ncbi:MAG: hypothetical protein QG630_261 [Patescibacteria group bacterium]|nr:hypothetical protein [Patescibacteria group bacterium]
MRKYRSQRIQKTLIALSGAALASTMMFTSAQNISKSDNFANGNTTYYQTKINSQLHKAVKAKKEEKHIKKKNKIKKKVEESL